MSTSRARGEEDLSIINRQMENLTLSPPPNHIQQPMLRTEINRLFNAFVERSYPNLKNYAFVFPLEAAHREHGDYACFSILEICEELRKQDPHLFNRGKTLKDIAMDMMRRFQSQIYNMVNQQSITVHDDGIITFRLDWQFITQRITIMLSHGIDSWAPKIFNRRARALFVQKVDPFNANTVRASCIRDAIVRMFFYSGIDIDPIEFNRYRSPNTVPAHLENIRHGVRRNKADIMVFVIPHLYRECIQQSFQIAREEWRTQCQLLCCGYNTFCIDQGGKQALWRQFNEYYHSTAFHSLAEDAGYTPDTSFSCILKYTSLKRRRLAEVTFDIVEMVDPEGNTFVNLLRTKALIRSLIKFPGSRGWGPPGPHMGNKGERELGLHLVEFTRAIEDACKALLPHVVCEYMFNLSRLFTSYYNEVQHGEPLSMLSKATEVVMDKCLDLLGIGPDPSLLLDVKHLFDVGKVFHEERYDPRILSYSETRYSRSRLEMFTLSLGLAGSNFDEGDIFGTVFVIDALGARSEGWTKSDQKDRCYVAYFNHDWPDSVAFANGSLIPFGDPSCHRSVPVSSSLEVDARLHVTSKEKDQCYLAFHGRPVVSFRDFWREDQKWKCGSLKVGGVDDDTRVLMNFILIKDAIDTSIDLNFDSSDSDVPLKISASILAYYGDDVVKDDILGEYKAVLFRTNQSELLGNQVRLPLNRTALAVPANGCLNIDVSIMDVDRDEPIMHGTRKYRARTCDSDDWDIEYGKYSFNLRVTWI